jgi:hypothetical protein
MSLAVYRGPEFDQDEDVVQVSASSQRIVLTCVCFAAIEVDDLLLGMHRNCGRELEVRIGPNPINER